MVNKNTSKSFCIFVPAETTKAATPVFLLQINKQEEDYETYLYLP